jgi:hypothetical protein
VDTAKGSGGDVSSSAASTGAAFDAGEGSGSGQGSIGGSHSPGGGKDAGSEDEHAGTAAPAAAGNDDGSGDDQGTAGDAAEEGAQTAGANDEGSGTSEGAAGEAAEEDADAQVAAAAAAADAGEPPNQLHLLSLHPLTFEDDSDYVMDATGDVTFIGGEGAAGEDKRMAGRLRRLWRGQKRIARCAPRWHVRIHASCVHLRSAGWGGGCACTWHLRVFTFAARTTSLARLW